MNILQENLFNLSKNIAADITRDREDINCKWIKELKKVFTLINYYTENCVCSRNQSTHACSSFVWCLLTVINRNRRSNGGITGSSQQLNAQQQPQQTGPQQQQQAVNMQVNSIKQVNKVKPNVNRQPPDNAVSPSTYNRYDRDHSHITKFNLNERYNILFSVEQKNRFVWVLFSVFILFSVWPIHSCWFQVAANKSLTFYLSSFMCVLNHIKEEKN